jgi:hypothetical protein
MRKVKRWRYYCDYCKKSGGSRYHLEKHEKGCTNNPNRECGFCRMVGFEQPDLKKMIAFLKDSVTHEPWHWEDDDYEENNIKKGKTEAGILKELAEMANDCPGCMLAALRQAKLTSLFSKFRFKDYKGTFWAEHKSEPDYYGYY